MKVPIKILKSSSFCAGFTLIELLVAASITTIVVALAGSGVVAMLQSSNKAQSENLRRTELNRALDFINEEVRMAKSIATDASANLSVVAPAFDSTGKTPVLTLEIPGVSQRVIYYLKDASSPWAGPKVIYRWGPGFEKNGRYTENDNDPNTHEPHPQNPADWKESLLVDFIADTKPYISTACPPITTTTNWSANPASANGQGFSTCVLPYANNEPSGKIAEIKLRGQLTDGYGNAKDTLEVSTDTFARSSDPLSFTTSGGTVTITQPSTASFEFLGGSTSFTYLGKTYTIPTNTEINETTKGGTKSPAKPGPSNGKPASLTNLASGTTLTVTGKADSLGSYGGFPVNSETDQKTQVWMLRDGDTAPPFTAYPGQPQPEAFFSKYLENGKVKLAANQVIYLFEVTTKDKTKNDYDMQDIVVLATITPQ